MPEARADALTRIVTLAREHGLGVDEIAHALDAARDDQPAEKGSSPKAVRFGA